jgi:hypothetical protein
MLRLTSLGPYIYIYICVLDLIPVRFALTSAQMPSRAKIEERIGVRLVAMEELALLAWYHLSNSFRFIKLAYTGSILSSIVPLRFPQFPSEPLLETPARGRSLRFFGACGVGLCHATPVT